MKTTKNIKITWITTGFGVSNCLKFHSFDYIKLFHGIGFGIIIVELFSFACYIKV